MKNLSLRNVDNLVKSAFLWYSRLPNYRAPLWQVSCLNRTLLIILYICIYFSAEFPNLKDEGHILCHLISVCTVCLGLSVKILGVNTVMYLPEIFERIALNILYRSDQTAPNVISPHGFKTFFVLHSAEHEIFSANKYENANNCWYFHIYL